MIDTNEVKVIIRKCIEVKGATVEEIEETIEHTFGVQLSAIDHLYVERKYVRYCLKFWLNDIAELVKNSVKNKTFMVISSLIDLVNSLYDFRQVPEPFNNSTYYTLFISQLDCIGNKTVKEKLISKFKKECLETALVYSSSVPLECEFLQVFVQFLIDLHRSEIKDIVPVLNRLRDPATTSNEFLEKVSKLRVPISTGSLSKLQTRVNSLAETNEFFLLPKFKEVIDAFLKPAEISVKELDNRMVIEVTAGYIILSEVYNNVTSLLSKCQEVEEARFIGQVVLHIDRNLEQHLWHGKNIVLCSKVVKVCEKVEWNITGNSSNHSYSDDAGTNDEGEGNDGRDGWAGESGGNILIQADQIENPGNLIVISHGGNGSNGQRGGNGVNGVDGKGISYSDFVTKFPPPAKMFIIAAANRLHTIATSLSEVCATEKIVWHRRDCSLSDYVKDAWNYPKRPVYIEIETREGNEILFSHGTEGSLLLYKGSLGTSGKVGGSGGLGGEGGFPGELITQNANIVVDAKPGNHGKNGNDGRSGKHGKNGWDVGFTDWPLWSEPQYFGRDCNSKLNVKYYDSSDSSRIYITYHETFADIEVAGSVGDTSKNYDLSIRVRHANDRQRHALAQRKKHISKEAILHTYSKNLNYVDMSVLEKLSQSTSVIRQRSMHALTETRKQQEQRNIVIGTRYQAKHIYWNHHKRKTAVTKKKRNYRSTAKLQKIPKSKEINPFSDEYLLELKSKEHDYSQLNECFKLFDLYSKKGIKSNKIYKEAQELLVEKYRLAVLQEFANVIQDRRFVTEEPQLAIDDFAKYLTVSEEHENDEKIAFHDQLDDLHQYIFQDEEEQRNQVLKFCKNVQKNPEYKSMLLNVISIFVIEQGNSQINVHAAVQKYYKEYKDFTDQQKSDLRLLSDILQERFGKHGVTLEQWMEAIYNKEAVEKVKDKIKQDNTLQDLYESFVQRINERYDWKKCYKDDNAFDVFSNHVRSKGLRLTSYRELLSLIFNVNLRLYLEDNLNQLVLRDNHNSSSKQIIHILYQNDRFVRLMINKNYVMLQEERNKKSGVCTKILTQTLLLEGKTECDKYLITNRNVSFVDINYKENFPRDFDEEKALNEIGNSFSSLESKSTELKTKLEKLASKYIGKQSILYVLAKRFSFGGVHVSSEDMLFLVNSVFQYLIEGGTSLNVFSWIFAAYPQTHWINEITLLRLENYFKQRLPDEKTWRSYLRNVTDKDTLIQLMIKLQDYRYRNSVSMQCIQDILYLLSEIPEPMEGLEVLEVTQWPYALKEKYWTRKLSLFADWKEDELQKISYYFLSLENMSGTATVQRFLSILENKNSTKNSPRHLFASEDEVSSSTSTMTKTDFFQMLLNFHIEEWEFSEKILNIFCNFPVYQWMEKLRNVCLADGKERDITRLVELVKGNANTSTNISSKLDNIEDIVKQSKCHFIEHEIVQWAQQFTETVKHLSGKDKTEYIKGKHGEMLSVVNRAIELKRGFRLRDTQKLTVLTFLENGRSTLVQVSTGEGKSLIVVTLAIIKVLCGQRVDVVTSSSVLAKRDATCNNDIYSLFNVSVSHNCSEKIEERKETYSSSKVVYGDLSSFQRDYLLDRFYGKNIMGDRTFDNVIIDEVDSMLLDKGNNTLYLSHDIPGLDKLESIYVYIWQWINRPFTTQEECYQIFNTQTIKNAILSEIYDPINKECLRTLDTELTEQQINALWNNLIKLKVINQSGHVLKSYNDIKETLELSGASSVKDRLKYFLKQYLSRTKSIHVPNFLKPFIEHHLESWIESAKQALFMQERHDYVVDVDRTANKLDRNANITIIDRDTGTDQPNSQWENALHQFLQLKHGCKLSTQSLKAVFISNVTYLKLYEYLYGLTGTLGSQPERDLLRDIHEVDFAIIPTAISKQFTEDNPILCANLQDWIDNIRARANELVDNGRSVLIICEAVNDAETLYKSFGGKKAPHVHTYTRDYEEFDVATGDKELDGGHIIIATNLAGRGTDVKITEQLNRNKGLHVCLTYLPNNNRIEQQAFGRAARSGNKGSGQLIIVGSKGKQYSSSLIFGLKGERDFEEIRRISTIKAHYDSHITVEEYAFEKFKEKYTKLKKELSETSSSSIIKYLAPVCGDILQRAIDALSNEKEELQQLTEILLHNCLDKWAFWLDEKVRLLNETDGQGIRQFKNSLSDFITSINKKWLYKIDNPATSIKLGKHFAMNKRYDEAIETFNVVISQEPFFSEGAHYYKAFVLIKKLNGQKKPGSVEWTAVKKELRESNRLLNERMRESMVTSSIIGKLKQNTTNSIVQVNAFEEQQKSMCNLYSMFTVSVEDILGHVITPRTFVDFEIDTESAETLYKTLISENILRKPKIKWNVAADRIEAVPIVCRSWRKVLENYISSNRGSQKDEELLLKDLKMKLRVPKREEFWKLLKNGHALNDEVRYVVFDSTTLENTDSFVSNLLMGKIENKEITKGDKETLNCDENYILFNIEQSMQLNENTIVLEKSAVKSIVGVSKYKMLKKMGVFLCNKKARLNKDKISSVSFPYFDSITRKDLIEEGISESEATEILAELVEKKILEKTKNCYQLLFDDEDTSNITLSRYPVYQDLVNILVHVCFAYRFALRDLESKVKKECHPIQLQLVIKPHYNLMIHLVNQGILKPAKVAVQTDELEKKLQCIRKTDNLKVLSEERTLKRVCETLKRSTGMLKLLDAPDCSLNSLLQICDRPGDTGMQEIHVLITNGMEHVLQMIEQRWSYKMLLNASIVLAFGLCEIIIGVLIEMYSGGLMTHVGAVCLSEGASDIIYAISAFRSGYFSWSNYGQHKALSFAVSTITVGVGALVSGGANAAALSNRVTWPGVAIGVKTAVQITAKRTALKVLQAAAFGLASATVDTIIEKYLRDVCKGISCNLLVQIEQEVNKHKILGTLETVYKSLGKDQATRFVDELTNEFFESQTVFDKWVTAASEISRSVMRGVEMGYLRSGGDPNSYFGCAVNYGAKVQRVVAAALKLGRIPFLTNTLLTELNDQMTERLTNSTLRTRSKQSQIYNETEWQNFKANVVSRWKAALQRKASEIVESEILSPLLHRISNRLVELAIKKTRSMYEKYKKKQEEGYLQEFMKEKLKYQETMRNVPDDDIELKQQITKQYHDFLLKLCTKTRNPYLFAAIIKEQVPMDLTCVNACIPVIQCILKRHNINVDGITIIVEGEDGSIYKFTSVPEGKKGLEIKIKLKDNHFYMTNEDTNSTNNNCLYDALIECVPELKSISADDLRNEITNAVINDPLTRYAVIKGWHSIPIKGGIFGGAREIHQLNQKEESRRPSQSDWKYNEEKDVDLRTDNVLTPLENRVQQAEAFRKALEKINETLLDLQKKEKEPVTVNPKDFTPTSYDKVFLSSETVVGAFYPVDMETTVYVKVQGEMQKLTISINVDNPTFTPDCSGPRGPHIGYRVAGGKVKEIGHILLNFEGNEQLPHRRDNNIGPEIHQTCPKLCIPPEVLFRDPKNPDLSIFRTDRF